MNYIPFTISERGITLILGGKNHVVSADNGSYADIVNAVKSKKWEDIPALLDKATQLSIKSNGSFKVVDGAVQIDGKEIPEIISRKILKFMDEGLPFEPIVSFWTNLNRNPSFRARTSLFDFLEQQGHPLTEDGHFIAYKRVREDYKDFYTGKFDNSRDVVVKMQRRDVDDNPNHTCSKGLHVANLEYAERCYHSGQGRLIYVKVNPEHVVAIPTDYNGKKMRVCEYTVLGNFEAQLVGENLYRCCDNNAGVDVVPGKGEEDNYDAGYDKGYQDGLEDGRYGCCKDIETPDTQFGEGYADGYAEGYEEATDEDDGDETDEQAEYDSGYEDGMQFGKEDALKNNTGNDTDHTGKTESYIDGYSQGYDDGVYNVQNSLDYKSGFDAGRHDGRTAKNLDTIAEVVSLLNGSYERKAGYVDGYEKGFQEAHSGPTAPCCKVGHDEKAGDDVDFQNGFDMGYADHKMHTKKFDAFAGKTVRREIIEGYEAGWNKGKEERRAGR